MPTEMTPREIRPAETRPSVREAATDQRDTRRIQTPKNPGFQSAVPEPCLQGKIGLSTEDRVASPLFPEIAGIAILPTTGQVPGSIPSTASRPLIIRI